MSETLDEMRIRHSTERLDAAGPADRLILTRYGRPEAVTDGAHVLAVLHRVQGQSADWAIRHEGWDVVPTVLPGGFDHGPTFRGLLAWRDALDTLAAGRTLHRLDRWAAYAVRGIETARALVLGPDLDPYAVEHIVSPLLGSLTAALDYVDAGPIGVVRGEMAAHLAHLADYCRADYTR